MASGAMPFIVPITVPISDVEIWLVRRFQLVFLNLPETREERVRRDEREKTREEEEQKRIEEVAKVQKDAEQRRMEERAEFNALAATWLARMQEAHEKGEPFDEPPPWDA